MGSKHFVKALLAPNAKPIGTATRIATTYPRATSHSEHITCSPRPSSSPSSPLVNGCDRYLLLASYVAMGEGKSFFFLLASYVAVLSPCQISRKITSPTRGIT